MENQRRPFAAHAARWSVAIAVCGYACSYMVNSMRMPSGKAAFAVSVIVMAAVFGGGLVLAIIALCGMKTHGRKSICGWAITGLVLNGLLLTSLVLLFPMLAKVKSLVEKRKASASILTEDARQYQISGTVPRASIFVRGARAGGAASAGG